MLGVELILVKVVFVWDINPNLIPLLGMLSLAAIYAVAFW